MKIGIDVDGVILDYVDIVRSYAELYDMVELGKNGVINKDGFKVKERYDWTKEEFKVFADRYFVDLTKDAPVFPNTGKVLKMLKDDGHELVLITARGSLHEEAITTCLEIFEKNDIKLDKYFWKMDSKIEVCLEENVDIMIDDYWDTCRRASENNIYALYFRGRGYRELNESKYLREVSNWGEIYRVIKSIGGK